MGGAWLQPTPARGGMGIAHSPGLSRRSRRERHRNRSYIDSGDGIGPFSSGTRVNRRGTITVYGADGSAVDYTIDAS
jgi:hypothetical protein